MFDRATMDTAARVLDACRRREVMLVTAESCTGGLVAGALTSLPGSSVAFDCACVTYSCDAKSAILGVPRELVRYHGAVSEEVARSMVAGALARRPGCVAVAVTGVAGPGSDSRAKPAGLVHFAAALGACVKVRVRRYGDRGRLPVRLAAVHDALLLVEELLCAGTAADAESAAAP